MEPGAPYIPIDRRLALALGEDLPEQATGAALFADISGFTPLTEALARELGPRRGAEELTRQLDVVYSAIIGEVDRYRGSVIGFAGDAITCWFDGDNGSRSVACALAMQRVMRLVGEVRTPSGAVIPLAIKVASASGPVRRFRVGDPAVQFIDVLAGATLYRMAEAEHQAERGDVVVSPEVVLQLDDALVVSEWRHDHDSGHSFAVVGALNRSTDPDPWPDIPAASLDVGMVRPWLHPHVYERLAGGQGRFLAELRPAVALFMRFGGLEFDSDHAAGRKLDVFIRRVQAVLARYEGTLIQLTIGDKGSFLYSAFGAPVAHDDDASRAVAAALELRGLPHELGFINSLQIGISQGRMRAGAYGGPTARTYGVLGDEVNMAARLMGKAAPGDILVSQRIADAVSRHFDLHLVGPITVKGKSAPVLVSLVRGRRTAASETSTGPFAGAPVGRENELAQLDIILRSVLDGEGQLLRIEGPAGIGKSHLAAVLIARAADLGFQTVVGACQSTTEHSAYAPWRQAWHTLLGLDVAAPEQDAPTIAASQLALVQQAISAANPDWILRLPVLSDLLGLDIADNPTTAAFEPRLRQRALVDLVVEMAQSWAGRAPLLVLLDDVHWMDEASQGLTLALARVLRGARIFLVATHRPPLAGQPILPKLDDSGPQTRLDLGDLSAEAVAGLITNRLGGPAAALVLQLIGSETGGNPFFVEEVVDALRESGSIVQGDDGRWLVSRSMLDALRRGNCVVREDGEWVVAPNASLSAADLGLPDSIGGVVLNRLDRLAEAPKLTVKVASVIGRVFGIALLARTHPLQPEAAALEEQITVLESRDFARLEVPPPATAYIFKHNVTQEVAYETLLYDQRRGLHATVGRELEALAPGEIDQLAYHSFLGEDWPRAMRYQLAAGQRAQRLFANHAAIDHLEKAAHCAAQLPPAATLAGRHEIEAGLGQLLTATGQYEPAMEHLKAALALAEELGAAEERATACRWIARIYEYRGDYPNALTWINAGLGALGEAETATTAELLAIAGLIQTRLGNYEQANGPIGRGIAIAERLDDKAALAFASNSRAVVSIIRGNTREAAEYFGQTRDLYQQIHNIQGQAMAANGLANASFNLGNWSEADLYYRQAGRIFNQTGDIYNLAFVENNLGGIALNQGRLDDALGYYSRALQILEQLGGSLYVVGVLHMNLGATFVRRGEIDAAREHLNRSQELYAQAEARDFLPELARHFAGADLLVPDRAGAEAHAQSALALARELEMRAEEGSSLYLLAQIASENGDTATAEGHLIAATAILEEVGQEYELARAQLALAALQLGAGRHEEGRALLDRCTASLARLDAAPDLLAAQSLRAKYALLEQPGVS